jgi:hypothetical protein
LAQYHPTWSETTTTTTMMLVAAAADIDRERQAIYNYIFSSFF